MVLRAVDIVTEVVAPEDPLQRVLARMIDTRYRSFPVVASDRLVGVITREDIQSYLDRLDGGSLTVTEVEPNLWLARTPDDARIFAARLLERINGTTGVEVAAIASAVPLDIHGLPQRSFALAGIPRPTAVVGIHSEPSPLRIDTDRHAPGRRCASAAHW